MTAKRKTIIAALVALICGIAAAAALAATQTTGTVSACAGGAPVMIGSKTVGTEPTTCVTTTYTVPTTTVTVTATPTTSSTSSTSTTTSSTTTTSPPPTGALVGVAADPKVTCSVQVATQAALTSALATAPSGSTVCLTTMNGSFGDIDISGASTKTITIDGQSDTVGDVGISAQVANLTLEGMKAQSFYIGDPTSNITIQYNTVSHVAKGDAIVLDSNAHGASGTISGTMVRYNQIDHVGECLGDTYSQQNTTFTHNVCGPGLGYGDTASTDPGHYIQTGGENNMTVTRNAFLGPADPAESVGLHLNVFHDWGTSANLTFTGNLLWHDDAIGQAMLLQTGHFDNVTVQNNVAVENPSDGYGTYTFWMDATHTGSFSNNTTVGSVYGNDITENQTSQDYTGDTGFTAANNLTTGTTDNADCNYRADITATNNYSGDTSCANRFTSGWQNSSWTPSLPYTAPPAGWYQPSGLSGVGYQGAVGP